MTHPSFSFLTTDRLDDSRVLVVEDVNDDITTVLTIACDDRRFIRYIEDVS